MLWSFLSFLKEKFKYVNWGLILIVLLIIGLGLMNLYSSSDARIKPMRFYSQIIFVCFGLCVALFVATFINLKTIEVFSLPFYIIVCVLLLFVDISGSAAKGAERWIGLGFFKLQPSELAKIAIILIIAKSFANIQAPIQGFSLLNFWKQFLYLLIPFVLILRQPDLTTAGILFLIVILQLLLLPIKINSLIKAGVVGLTIGLIGWSFLLHDYQRQRVLTFLNPIHDLQGSSYQSIQSMIAVGSGQWIGMGFEQGSQAKFKFLPERHTDLAFSVWAEEQGFLGCLLVICLYVVFILQIFQIARSAQSTFSAMVASGIGIFFMLHFLINIGMVLGLFPVAGIPLAFFGYGGANMITALFAVGLLLNIDREQRMNVA